MVSTGFAFHDRMPVGIIIMKQYNEIIKLAKERGSQAPGDFPGC